MSNNKPGTLPYVVKKWAPLTAGVGGSDGLTGHAAEICAWSMEEEARWLRSDKNGGVVGEGLKYVFATIRRTMDKLTADDTALNSEISPEVVREITVESAADVFEACRTTTPEDKRNALDTLHQALLDDDFAGELAARLHASILSFPG